MTGHTDVGRDEKTAWLTGGQRESEEMIVSHSGRDVTASPRLTGEEGDSDDSPVCLSVRVEIVQHSQMEHRRQDEEGHRFVVLGDLISRARRQTPCELDVRLSRQIAGEGEGAKVILT